MLIKINSSPKQWDPRFNTVIVSDMPIECIVTGFVDTEVPGLFVERKWKLSKNAENRKFKLELLTKSFYWDHFPKIALGYSDFFLLVMSITTVFLLQILRVDFKIWIN